MLCKFRSFFNFCPKTVSFYNYSSYLCIIISKPINMKLLPFLLLMLLPVTASADAVKIDCVWYNQILKR